MRINEGHKDILHIALPAIVSNITVPLLGLVDVSIVGQLRCSRLYRCDSGGRNAFQYILLDIRIFANGYERYDIAGLWTARSR